jgi:farnesyl-diphosphate farnesyltransferase
VAVNRPTPKLPTLSHTALDTVAFERLLKRMARSFALSLRILPPDIRPTLSLAYMLARASDTIADASTAPDFQRLALLRSLPGSYPEKSPELGLEENEKELLDLLPELMGILAMLPDAPEIKDAWQIILQGQIYDLERFQGASAQAPAPSFTPEELNEYTYLVAGSVGEFWTRICCKHIPDYSSRTLDELLPVARRYGQALQMVNILRDRRRDALIGRIYIPDDRFYPEMQHAFEMLAAGKEYIAAVNPRSLRAACALPLDLAHQTLALVAEHPLGERVKVPRHKVWIAFAKAFWS